MGDSQNMGDLQNQVESILFSAGAWMTVEEIAKIAGKREEEVLSALLKVKKKYENSETLDVREDKGAWKLTIRDRYLPLARKIVRKTEMSKAIMETLAVVAFKAPVLQSYIIKVRNNKAYDHLSQLEKAGFIAREKKGRSKIIRLGKKFFDYFDIPSEKVMEYFAPVARLEEEVLSAEAKAAALKKSFEEKTADVQKREKERAEREFREKEKIDVELEKMPKIEVGGVPVETYETPVEEVKESLSIAETNLLPDEEKLGELEVVDEEVVKEGEKVVHWGPFDVVDVEGEKKREAEKAFAPSEAEILEEETEEKKEGKGMYSEGMPEHVKSRVEKRVKELLGELNEEEKEQK